MTRTKDKVYVLNPGYQLRNDVHRVALFAKVGSGDSCSKDWHTFIHPVQAAMLSFFTYNRSLDENLRLCYIWNADENIDTFIREHYSARKTANDIK